MVLEIMQVRKQKEIARLQRELRDTKDALEVLKKAIGILGTDKLFTRLLLST